MPQQKNKLLIYTTIKLLAIEWNVVICTRGCHNWMPTEQFCEGDTYCIFISVLM